MKRTALLSVYNKDGIVEFARGLLEFGFELIASGGTAAALREANLPVMDVADLVGGGAILGHRVVTLSREVHAGLLARDNEDDPGDLARRGIPFIDLVCVDLYPLRAEIERKDSTPESVIEMTDIGGSTMLRSAAKGRRFVISDPAERERFLDALREGLLDDQRDSEFMRRMQAARAEAVVAEYCLDSARYHGGGSYDGFVGTRVAECQYGENSWQVPAALYSTRTGDPLALDRFEIVRGTPSFNNFADLDRLLQTLTHIAAGFEKNFGEVPFIAVAVKHGNACGAAVGSDALEVLERTVMGDPRAIFGGLVMTNFALDEKAAETLRYFGMEEGQRRLLDAVVAPAVNEKAIAALERKGDKCRVLVNRALAQVGIGLLDQAPRFRYVRGGFMVQPNYTFVLDFSDLELVKTGEMTEEQQYDAVLAWAVAATSNSNTITLVRDGQLIGNGVGQQDRVGCCELAIKRAEDAEKQAREVGCPRSDLEGAVAASDSFFPFPDGPETLVQAGITAILATSGSVRDGEIRELLASYNVAFWQLPDKKARGFFGH